MYKVLSYFFFLLPFVTSAQEYNYVHYDTKDGLAGSTVYDMCQDKDGFMWFATENGLSRYDGTRFKNFTVKDGLPDNETLKIFSDSKGRLWVGTFNKEICYYYKGKIYNKNNDTLVKKMHLEGLLTSMAETNAGLIAFSDTRFVILLQPSQSGTDIIKTEMPGNYVRTNLKRDKIEAGNPDFENFIFENGKFKYAYTAARDSLFPKDNKNYFLVKFDHDQNIALIIERKPGFINNSMVNGLASFFNTTDGTWSIDTVKGKWETHFLPGKKITAALKDKESNLWFSTIGNGVYKLPSTETKTIQFTSTDNLAGDEVFSLAKTNGNLICGTGFSKAVFLNNGKFTKTLDYSNKVDESKYQSKTNRLYCSKVLSTGITMLGFDAFLLKLENGKTYFSNIFPTKSVEEIDKEYIIIGTSSFIFKLRVSDLKITDTIWRERCTKVFYNNSKYYIGTINGLYEVNEDKSYKYLGDLHPSLKRRITDIKAAPGGSMWIATSDEGLVAYNGKAITAAIKDSNGLSSNICKTLFLKDNYLWVGTNKGINKIDISRTNYPIVKYSSSDGLPSDIINAIYVEDSVVYAGTPAGLTFFNEKKISNTSVCDLKMLSVSVSGKEQAEDSNYILSYKNNNIRFEYIAISFKSGGDIVYHYKLSGLDDEWQQTTQTFLDYLTLPPNEYELQLYATNKFGVKSETVKMRFSIGTPFWKAWWFYTFLLLIAGALISWLVNRRIKKQRLKLEERNSQDKQFAALEQQALQAQMNPHFIFNCLNSIQQYILTNDKEKANEYLTGFASLIRQTLDNSGKKTISITGEVRYLTQYLEMEKMRFGDNFSYHIVLDNSIDADNIEIPALLLQPYVENCLRHGIRYKADGTGNVDIRFTVENEVLYCAVKDNGVGRAKAAELKNVGHIEYQSRGMGLTAKRIALFNKMDENKIEVSINDLADAAGNATGTEVILKIPL